MAKDPTDSSMPTSKMILLDQLKRYNNNIRLWIDSRFLPIENMRNIIRIIRGWLRVDILHRQIAGQLGWRRVDAHHGTIPVLQCWQLNWWC